ncbi:hypothetical protein AAFC00_003145 [Neodothiora populina]
MGRTASTGPLLPGSTLSIGGKDVEIDSVVAKEDGETNTVKPVFVKPSYIPPRPVQATTMFKKPIVKLEKTDVVVPRNIHARAQELPKRTNTEFRNPLLQKTQLSRTTSDVRVPVPRHDPDAEGALVMKRPLNAPNGKHIVDVVIDPVINKHLRDHQKSGVAFMYECVMGLRDFEGEGAILADEMGLGKTLQTIALIWTLLKQNPIYEDGPVIKKALIVCPATLINNWRKEFRKWLGNERIGVLVAENNKTRLTDFTKGKSYSVMIIGYEKLRNVQAELQKGAGIDIVICDEGHRLKTAQNKSAMAIKSLSTERRIILSGTPIQNDLSEFYTMVDFVNPGLLNKYTTFKRDFETPILKSRQPGASAKDIEKGRDRSQELASLTGQFILRRTADILAKYLPPKTEFVLYCRPTEVQVACYEAIIGTDIFDNALRNSDSSFQLINVFKKVCNGPKLLLKETSEDRQGPNATLVAAITQRVPVKHLRSSSGSSKMHVLDSLLHVLRTTTEEKVVIVSNYTATLDALTKLLVAMDYPYSRLDGSTPVAQRQDLVDRFNRSPAAASFVFLLSAKAGGVGINLIGASRLILYDIDWNPAVDLQAMARIHRDGQKRPCYIYRFITKGALEEKIYQRQLSKQDLSDNIVDNKNTASTFTAQELRDLFTLDRRVGCQTHDSLACPCGGKKTDSQQLSVNPSAAPSPPSLDTDAAIEADNDDIVVDENSDDVESLPDLPDLPTFMRSSQVDMMVEEVKREERRRLEIARVDAKTRTKDKDNKGSGKLQSLMRYAHVDCVLLRASSVGQSGGDGMKIKSMGSLEDEEVDDEGGAREEDFTFESAIEDQALRTVVAEEGSRVDFIFAKTSS